MPRRRRKIAIAYPRDAATEDRVEAVAQRTSERNRLSPATERWRPFMATQQDLERPAATFALDDYSQIPFVKSVVGVGWYQYRARLRCSDGDGYAVAADEIEGYEAYNRQYLGLGETHLLRLERAPVSDLSLARRLLANPEVFTALRELVRAKGELRVHPYMSIQPVWELAERIAADTGAAVRVVGPPPHLTALVNDKARFSELVEDLFGREALARTSVSTDPQELSDLLREEVHRSSAVALKMPSCASGMGNRIFDGPSLRGHSLERFRALVDRFLQDKEWDGAEPVLVVEWHRDVLESPSTQCWIPPLGSEEPVVEEVFQQLLAGEEQVFQGAVLSSLPRALRNQFMIRSWLLCRVFQRLGYVGRCSFDALVVGPTLREGTVRFVECNGRWGGTSTPMHLMKRVFGDFRGIPYRGQGYVDERLRGFTFPALLELLGPQLYDRSTGRGRVLLYNVGGITEHGKFDMVVTGRSYADVQRFISERLPRRIERYLKRA